MVANICIEYFGGKSNRMGVEISEISELNIFIYMFKFDVARLDSSVAEVRSTSFLIDHI